MKFPICKVCLKNDILCDACKKKLRSEKIRVNEAKMFRELNAKLRSYPFLKDVEITRAIEDDDSLLIIARDQDVSKLIGKDGGMVKKLAKDLNRQVRIMGKPSDLRGLVNEVFFSIPVLGVNVVYDLEGEKHKVRIPFSERDKLPISPETFSSISNQFLGIDVEVVFE